MFMDLLNQAKQLMGLAKEARMESQSFINEQSEQVRLFKLLREYDQMSVSIGHVQYMVNYFEHAWRSTSLVEDLTNNHQAMMLSRKHLIELQARKDELEANINYLRSQQ